MCLHGPWQMDVSILLLFLSSWSSVPFYLFDSHHFFSCFKHQHRYSILHVWCNFHHTLYTVTVTKIKIHRNIFCAYFWIYMYVWLLVRGIAADSALMWMHVSESICTPCQLLSFSYNINGTRTVYVHVWKHIWWINAPTCTNVFFFSMRLIPGTPQDDY